MSVDIFMELTIFFLIVAGTMFYYENKRYLDTKNENEELERHIESNGHIEMKGNTDEQRNNRCDNCTNKTDDTGLRHNIAKNKD